MPSIKELSKKANLLLEKFSISKPPVHIKEIVKGLGIDIRSEDLGESVSGFIVFKNETPVICVNKNDGIERKRFTIAHELCHFLFHRSSKDALFISKVVHFRDELSSLGELNKEKEANAFAAALLMPELFISESIKKLPNNMSDEDAIKKLAAEFKVSEVAMTYRLSNLKLLY